MPRFGAMVISALEQSGIPTEPTSAKALLYKLPLPASVRKWLGYIDLYAIFGFRLWLRALRSNKDTIFIFVDQAQGPLIPFVVGKPHVIHVHDLLAIRSALGEFAENQTSFSGRLFQRLIVKGLSRANNLVAVSEQTGGDLRRLVHLNRAAHVAVVPNSLNFDFRPVASEESCSALLRLLPRFESATFILHVGGNQWYKNRIGVLEIYEKLLSAFDNDVPGLVMVGSPPEQAHLALAERARKRGGTVHFVVGASNEDVRALYCEAKLMLFPSIAEGFGWPIAEAIACGCRVVTTGDAPMTEVGGDAVSYIPRGGALGDMAWAEECASVVRGVLLEPESTRTEYINRGLKRATMFLPQFAKNAYLDAYQAAVQRAISRSGNTGQEAFSE